MKTEKTIGWLFIAGALGALIPYTVLTVTFNYPNILRADTGHILTQFHAGGSSLIFTWWAFAMLGLPLVPAYMLLGRQIEQQFAWVRIATGVGVTGLLVQVIGLLRWTFVVPVLSTDYVTGTEATRQAAVIAFKIVHQYGGVVLGEHLGQLFTIVWTVMITAALAKLRLFAGWVNWLGYIASGIYLLAQTELFATVIPGFPVVGFAGFVGSTLWIIWLIVIGVSLLRKNTRLQTTNVKSLAF